MVLVIGVVFGLMGLFLLLHAMKNCSALQGVKGLPLKRLILGILLLSISFALTTGYVTYPPFHITNSWNLLISVAFVWVIMGASLLSLIETARSIDKLPAETRRKLTGEPD